MIIPSYLRYPFIHFRNWWMQGELGLPLTIGIEISTGCNRQCWYCPQSTDPQPRQIITNDLWQIFLFRLTELKWNGLIGLGQYGEPTLVSGYDQYISQVRERCPKSIILINSNGDRPEVLLDYLKSGASRIVITEHPPFNPEWKIKLNPIIKQHPFRITVRKITSKIRHNHAGQVKMKEYIRYNTCPNGAMGMPISINGDVCLCCWDYKHQFIYGNIKNESLIEIWQNSKLKQHRELAMRGYPPNKLCQECLK